MQSRGNVLTPEAPASIRVGEKPRLSHTILLHVLLFPGMADETAVSQSFAGGRHIHLDAHLAPDTPASRLGLQQDPGPPPNHIILLSTNKVP